VYEELSAMGCCQAACTGFAGVSSNFFGYKRKKSDAGARSSVGGVTERLSAEEALLLPCCADGCMPSVLPETVERLRLDLAAVEGNRAEVDLVWKRFLYDPQQAVVRGFCNTKLRQLAPVGSDHLKRLRREIIEDGCACARATKHGMIAWREEHPPPNRTNEATEKACLQQLKHMTIPLPEGRRGKLRKCFDYRVDSIEGLRRNYNEQWAAAYGTHADGQPRGV